MSIEQTEYKTVICTESNAEFKAKEVVSSDFAGLYMLIRIFCEFWGRDPAVGKLNETTLIAPEFGQAITDGNERRRKETGALVDRLAAGKQASRHQWQNTTHLIFGMTSHGMFKALSVNRQQDAACELIGKSCSALLKALLTRERRIRRPRS